MITLEEKHWKPIEEQLREYFWQWYYEPILKLMQSEYYNSRYNSNNALIAAIRAGRVVYRNGEFTGTFNSRISRELSKFAKYDKRSKSWKGTPPPEVMAAAVTANAKAEQLNERILAELNQIDARVKKEVENLSMNITQTVKEIDGQLKKDVQGITVLPEITDEMREYFAKNYTENMRLNIVNENGPGNWNAEQIERLRDMVERNVMRGSNRIELQKMIESEWDTSVNKARFLARQETSLFLAKMRDQRYQSAGVRKWKWSSSQDSRVRPHHKELNGKVFTYDSPPIINLETGERGMPGEDYFCRCSLVPLLD